MRRKGFGWFLRPQHWFYHPVREMDRKEVEKAVREALSGAEKGSPWIDPHGVQHIPILRQKVAIGNLWKDVPLKDLETGAYWITPRGVKVELRHNGNAVGMCWISL